MKKAEIFTRLTNEVREDNVEIIRKFRKDIELHNEFKHIPSRLHSTYDATKRFQEEVDRILLGVDNASLCATDSTWESNTTIKSKMTSNTAHTTKQSNNHSRIKEITENWYHGPVSIEQVGSSNFHH